MRNYKIVIAIWLFSMTICSFAFTQDLFNYSNSLKFANYLFTNHEYKLAESEYHRLHVLNKKDTLVYHNFLLCNYKLNRYSKIESYYQLKTSLSQDIFIRSGILSGNYLSIPKEIYSESAKYNMYELTWYLLNEDYDHAQSELNKCNATTKKLFSPVFQELENTKFKNPILAGSMSALVPGSGKVYSGYWKDGLISFIFTGVSAWQAYRGFEKKGVKSAYGWVYSGMTFGFYLGNIYGSVKSANKYNQQIKHRIKHATQDIFKSLPF